MGDQIITINNTEVANFEKLEQIFAGLKDITKDLGKSLDKAVGHLEKMSGAITAMAGGASGIVVFQQSVSSSFQQIDLSLETTAGIMSATMTDIAYSAETTGMAIMGFAGVMEESGEQMSPAMSAMQGFIGQMQQGQTVFGNLGESIAGVIPTLSGLADEYAIFTPILEGAQAVMGAVTIAQEAMALCSSVVSIATGAWTAAQWLLNAALWANPITWIVAAIAALIGAILLCVTKVQGWGDQWRSIMDFMKLSAEWFVAKIKLNFNALVSGIMNCFDKIRIGWLKLKSFFGNKEENQLKIQEIEEGIKERAQAITDGMAEVQGLATQAKDALQWKLSIKKKDGEEALEEVDEDGLPGGGVNTVITQVNKYGGASAGKGAKQDEAAAENFDADKIIPNMKGSTAYSAITAKLAGSSPSAMPATVSATSIPETENSLLTAKDTEYEDDQQSQTINMTKFCDTLEIHIANADEKGYSQIEEEVTQVLKKIFDDYGA